ncbi:TetR/AcrR family transcriptional regulator [Myxococcus sp. K15C18031901]|uniref:TetR/AcrR family transcriptional regulator n=1 Tax=Myxococcus dinghuensis TaxID=2906761 RepID=UPI0020A7A525|nr:TetR/AcrR family transcriptional regulator [Myxococcus dinghuensis]MCP3100657.1 TetR/AcrR family transcriptional regulator [Myxococcus dinghuensis]
MPSNGSSSGGRRPGGSRRRAPAPAPTVPAEPPDAERQARKARRQEGRRKAILAAARAVLVREGVLGLTLEAVASEADLSKPSLFYYFRSKEDLVGALALEGLAREVEALEAAVAHAPSGVEALATLVRVKVDLYAEDLDAFRVVYLWPQFLGSQSEAFRERLYGLSARLNDTLEARLQADLKAGRLGAGLQPRRLANVAWTVAHGLLSMVAGMEGAGGTTRHALSQLRDEACALLLRSGTR